MKVCISVPGRFHGFDLALELDNRGILHTLITSYPRNKVRQFGIRKAAVKTLIGKEIVVRVFYRMFRRYPKWFWLNEWYDRAASLKMPMDADVYVLWAGFALHTLRRIRNKNPKAKIIIERGSAHIEEQARLLDLVGQNEDILEALLAKEKNEYDECDFISVPSRFVAQTFLERRIKREKISINPYGVDLKRFDSSGAVGKSDPFTVGYVGVVSKQKNVEGIIRSVETLTKRNYAIRLIIAGGIDTDSYPKDFLRQFDFITYVGNVPQNQLPSVYQQMDAFVLNSVQDGFGMVLLQAMAMGVPPIATENTGGPDVIQSRENGFVIPVLNDEALVASIEFLILNPQVRMNMSDACRVTVSKGFSWVDYGNRAVAFYQTII